jgi:hypothetical protein
LHRLLQHTRSNSSSSSVDVVSSLGDLTGCKYDTSRLQVGYYKGNLVAIKRISKKTVDLKRSILKELNTASG